MWKPCLQSFFQNPFMLKNNCKLSHTTFIIDMLFYDLRNKLLSYDLHFNLTIDTFKNWFIVLFCLFVSASEYFPHTDPSWYIQNRSSKTEQNQWNIQYHQQMFRKTHGVNDNVAQRTDQFLSNKKENRSLLEMSTLK